MLRLLKLLLLNLHCLEVNGKFEIRYGLEGRHYIQRTKEHDYCYTCFAKNGWLL